jgi:hypothetical protein
MVYILNQYGKPLMPTDRYGKVRHLLKVNLAKVINRCPFTIQLMYDTKNHTQQISLGVDAGSKVIGLSATTKDKELYASEVTLRNDIVDLLSTKRQNRRTRRNHLRYRKPRFNNRVSSKNKGWLAPSVENKIQSHISVVNQVYKILPITNIIVEVASFDIQKINNPNISGEEYQQGEQLNFWNIREYVLFRDNHTCQCCKGKSKDKILNVHHIESRKTGGDSPKNLITFCETCHTGYHKEKIQIPKNIKRGMSFRDASFMGIMRWDFYNKLKDLYPNVSLTYGYITKNIRISHSLEKTHYIDARCISNNPTAEPSNVVYFQKKIRCHNRQIHKAKILKGGNRKLNQAPYLVKDFRLFDKVLYKNQECFISGRRSSGYFKLIKLDGTVIHNTAKVNDLKLLETRKPYLTESRKAV